jgi:hypothetical protein
MPLADSIDHTCRVPIRMDGTKGALEVYQEFVIHALNNPHWVFSVEQVNKCCRFRAAPNPAELMSGHHHVIRPPPRACWNSAAVATDERALYASVLGCTAL